MPFLQPFCNTGGGIAVKAVRNLTSLLIINILGNGFVFMMLQFFPLLPGVSFSSTSSAFKLSSNCCFGGARDCCTTLGFLMHQAMPVQLWRCPAFCKITWSFLLFQTVIHHPAVFSASQSPCKEKAAVFGIPSLYLPLSKTTCQRAPDGGAQSNIFINLSCTQLLLWTALSNKLYCGCSMVGQSICIFLPPVCFP